MEASAVATPEAPPEPTPSHDGAAEATRSTEELFQWSGFVDVGRGAAECEHALDGSCRDPKHFHAWVCLPNTFQIRDITDKARAAKARKQRALRNPETESHDVLEAELDELVADHYDELVDALARAEVEKYLGELMRDLESEERFENHAQDIEELNRLRALPDDERSTEEFEQLEADAIAYGEALQKKIDERIAGEAERLRALPVEELVALERKGRIDMIGTEAYLHAYYTWSMFIGTREPSTIGFSPRRKFATADDLKNAPPEVVVALREKIRDLEQRTMDRGDAAGNS